jgi:hypothetical protein
MPARPLPQMGVPARHTSLGGRDPQRVRTDASTRLPFYPRKRTSERTCREVGLMPETKVATSDFERPNCGNRVAFMIELPPQHRSNFRFRARTR